ncbi:hypothetical protein GCM10027613_11030 [Microlunatus endophyticus]
MQPSAPVLVLGRLWGAVVVDDWLLQAAATSTAPARTATAAGLRRRVISFVIMDCSNSWAYDECRSPASVTPAAT